MSSGNNIILSCENFVSLVIGTFWSDSSSLNRLNALKSWEQLHTSKNICVCV